MNTYTVKLTMHIEALSLADAALVAEAAVVNHNINLIHGSDAAACPHIGPQKRRCYIDAIDSVKEAK